MTLHIRSLTALSAAAAAALLSGCVAPPHGGRRRQAPSPARPAAATAENNNSALEKCTETLGTWRCRRMPTPLVRRPARAPARLHAAGAAPDGAAEQLLRHRRARRAMNNMMTERNLQASGEMRDNSNFGKGPDGGGRLHHEPEHPVRAEDRRRERRPADAPFGGLGALAGGMSANEASTTLLLIDNRSGVQILGGRGHLEELRLQPVRRLLRRLRRCRRRLLEHAAGQGGGGGLRRLVQPDGQGAAQLQGADRQGRPGHGRAPGRGRRHDAGLQGSQPAGPAAQPTKPPVKEVNPAGPAGPT